MYVYVLDSQEGQKKKLKKKKIQKAMSEIIGPCKICFKKT